MAVLKNSFLSINGVTLSTHVRSVSINAGVEPQDDTAMGDNTRSAEAGLKLWSLSVTFFQTFAASLVDATLFPLLGAAPFTVIVRPDADAVSTTNPNYTGSMILVTYPPITGEVGTEHMVTVEFQAAGDLSRATT